MHHSGRVLQGLSFQPSGAIVAAATTSLPEGIGGERNWDYRYSWVRDASFTMEALWVAACPDEASDFFAFLATAAASGIGPDAGLQIMFGVGGEHDLTERELPHLEGWRDSRPVRVGNGAWNQQQIDVYGELLGAAHRLADQLTDIDEDTKRFLIACADTAAGSWQHKDQGIWEVRGDPQHFLYSKVMCWVALDRAISLAGLLDATDRVEQWKRTRDEIWETVVRDGWNDQAGAFTQYIGSTTLDASNLMMPIVGFLPADDPRMLATIDAIAERLTDDRGLVYRYRAEEGIDGLSGEEGCFLLCTFWLAQALAQSGQVERARSRLRESSRLRQRRRPARRRDRTAEPANYSATSRRPSATSDSSTPPGPSPKPNASRPPADRNRLTHMSEPGMTITCQEMVDILSDYLEGSVDEATRQEIEAHLALCPGCAEYLRQMRSTLRTLGHIPLDTLSDAAKQDLTAAFRARSLTGARVTVQCRRSTTQHDDDDDRPCPAPGNDATNLLRGSGCGRPGRRCLLRLEARRRAVDVRQPASTRIRGEHWDSDPRARLGSPPARPRLCRDGARPGRAAGDRLCHNGVAGISHRHRERPTARRRSGAPEQQAAPRARRRRR